jgi:hypothetical protein
MTAADMTLTLYDRRLESVEELRQRIHVTAVRYDRDENLLAKLFLDAVHRYLSLPGHPPDMGGFISQEEFEKSKDDALCRGHVFLLGLTGFGRKPMGSNWSIEVRIIQHWQLTMCSHLFHSAARD